MSIDDGHGGLVCQGDLVGIVAADAHSVQVPEVGPLCNASAAHICADLVINCLHELITDVIACLDGLTCTSSSSSVSGAFLLQAVLIRVWLKKAYALAVRGRFYTIRMCQTKTKNHLKVIDNQNRLPQLRMDLQ